METVSEFPKFADGDITVVVSNSKIYRLHAHTLRRLSPVFAGLINEYPGAKLSAAARRDGCTPFRLELRHSPHHGKLGIFVRIRISDNGKLLRDQDSFPFAGTNPSGQNDEPDKFWDWLLGSFYNIAPKFEDHNLATVLNCCMGLVDVAEAVESVENIAEHVDLALLRQDQVLWRSVAANPIAWAELGGRLHSPSIFRESVCHLVGLWQKIPDEDKAEIRTEIRSLIEAKWRELDIAKHAIDMRILGHYPAFLCRSHTDKPHRTSYSQDIYMWMAVCFYRHWYAQAISEGRNRRAPDGGFEFYTKLAQGGNAYLHHEDFRAFHQYFPMSGKACNVLEANMNVLKEDMKSFVQDLVTVRTHVKNTDSQISWLTCAVIDKEDYPWEQADLAQSVLEREHFEDAMGLQQEDFGSSPLTPLEALGFGMPGYESTPPNRVSNQSFGPTVNSSELVPARANDSNAYGEVKMSDRK